MLSIHDEIMCPNCMHAKLLCNELNKHAILAMGSDICPEIWNNHFWNSTKYLQKVDVCVFYVTSRHRYKDNEVLQSWHSVAKQIPSGHAAKLVVTSRNWTPLSFWSPLIFCTVLLWCCTCLILCFCFACIGLFWICYLSF